jgi:hypothetical protein
VALDGAPPLEADAVIVATGGLSVPEHRERRHGAAHPRAARARRAPHLRRAHARHRRAGAVRELAGVSLRVTLTARDAAGTRASASGGFLFTHRGYSGPSVLDVSHVVVRSRAGGGRRRRRARRAVDAARRGGVGGAAAPAGHARGGVGGARELPDRLAAALLAAAGVEPTRRGRSPS